MFLLGRKWVWVTLPVAAVGVGFGISQKGQGQGQASDDDSWKVLFINVHYLKYGQYTFLQFYFAQLAFYLLKPLQHQSR